MVMNMFERWFLYMNKKYFYYFRGKVTALRQAESRVERNRDVHYSVDHVISWFLSKDSMSPKKLQKLLYYAYAWTLTLENEDVNLLNNRLFDEKFEAWVHGPVIPKVYRRYSHFGYNDIERNEEEVPKFQEDIESTLSQVWEVYGDYTGDELESITHQESPWINARAGYRPLDRCNEIINDKDIFECYGARI